MEQLNMYSYFGKEEDPLFLKLLPLDENKKIVISEYTIIKNQHDLYELSSIDEHESFSSIDHLYSFLKNKA